MPIENLTEKTAKPSLLETSQELPQTKYIQVNILASKHAKLEAISKEKGIALADLIRQLIDFYLILRSELKSEYNLVLEGPHDKIKLITPDIW